MMQDESKVLHCQLIKFKIKFNNYCEHCEVEFKLRI